jgi:PAS domain S-box-containing protein
MLPDRRVHQRNYLLEISRAITEELDLNQVLSRILSVSIELLAGRAGIIALRSEEVGWHIASAQGIQESFISGLDRLLADIPAHQDAARFEVPEVNRRLRRITEAASLGLLTAIGLPMIAQNQLVGVIFVFRAYRGSFTEADRDLLRGFASQAAIAVHNAGLFSQVAQQKQYLDKVLDSAADGIFILNPDLKISRFNRACAFITGYSQAEISGRNHEAVIRWGEVTSGLTLPDARAEGWPHAAGATLYVEGDLIRKDGKSVSVGITYAPVISPEAELLSIIGNMRDITKFRQADELKSTFISIISHELRTPVALIKGYVGTLRREDAQWDPAVVRQSLEVIEEEADRLTELIDDLLDASRLQAGGLPLNMSEVDLLQLIKQTVERFRTQTEKHVFRLDFPPDFPALHADEERLTQVITNLLSNAVKYSPSGGEIQIEGSAGDNEVSVCVHDQGPGISPEDADRIFDRFYRASGAMARTQGAGLGLFLAKAVVDAHGGRIWVDPSPEQGARLCFTLPKRQP